MKGKMSKGKSMKSGGMGKMSSSTLPTKSYKPDGMKPMKKSVNRNASGWR